MTIKDPKTITINNGKTYIISKFYAMAGVKIMTEFAEAFKSKTEWSERQALIVNLLSYVYVEVKGADPIPLSTPTLIDGYVDTWEGIVEIAKEVLLYNSDFFQQGTISDFLRSAGQKIQSKISGTLMDFLQQLSQIIRQPIENSNTNTH